MRIRTIKPEFWRSEDVAALSLSARLVFIGLWSYVDDEGRGRDDDAIIAAELFALDPSPAKMRKLIHDTLTELSVRALVIRYTVDGHRFLAIPTWQKHQKINRATKSRFPAPDQGIVKAHGALSEGSLLGTGEQGNRGTGEQGKLKPSSSEPRADSDSTEVTYSEDVIRLCSLLSELVTANGHKVGTIGKTWWAACDRLIRLDGFSPQQVEVIARWATGNEFWSANIRSMPKLREKFSTLRLQRNHELEKRRGTSTVEHGRQVDEILRQREGAGQSLLPVVAS